MVVAMTVRVSLQSRNRAPSATAERQANEWTLAELAHKLDMPEPTLYLWLRHGQFKARTVVSQSHRLWMIQATEEELMRLQIRRLSLRRNEAPIDSHAHISRSCL